MVRECIMSISNHSVESLATFLSVCQTTVAKDDGDTKDALASRARQIVKDLQLDLGATSGLTQDGRHPLVEACRTGNIKIAEMFVRSGADLNFVDPEGRSPLYAAIVGRNCSLKDIRQILQWGADVNLHRDGKLPLFASLYCMGSEVSRLLISEGADVNNVVLTCFCFIESVFALNSTFVMVMSGFQLRHDDLPAMITLASDIVLAGLLPKTFYLSSGRRQAALGNNGGQQFQLEEENLMSAELAMLWRLQHLCLCLGFRVDRVCLEGVIAEIREQVHIEGFTAPSDAVLIADADKSVVGVSDFSRFCLGFECQEQDNVKKMVRPDISNGDEEPGTSDSSGPDLGSGSHQESKRVTVLKNKLSQLLWMQNFQAGPMPLTYLTRVFIRAHLGQPAVSRGKHIEKAINVLPIPQMFRNFLALKDYRKSVDALL